MSVPLMEQTWRWFGPGDAITLPEIRQTGATGIVTALHDIPYGVAWTPEAIAERQAIIEADPALGLRWSVVESLPVSEAFKLGESTPTLIDNYRVSLANLGAAGIRTICYNFMPVLDWTRTDLAVKLPGGGTALRFDAAQYAAFDCFMLARQDAEADHTPDILARARAWFDRSSESDRDRLLANIMAGLPGAYDRYDIPGLRRMLDRYAGITAADLRAHLAAFLRAVVPAAEEAGVRLCIHPDDPPRPLFGLPRVVSNAEDIAFILDTLPSPANGLTLCTGSLGAGSANDLPEIARRFAARTEFVHLRNVRKDADGSFEEADHLGGDTDLVAVMEALLEHRAARRAANPETSPLPFRPDHGHVLLDDAARTAHPGYPLIGRMRGLAELRGVMTALCHVRGWPL